MYKDLSLTNMTKQWILFAVIYIATWQILTVEMPVGTIGVFFCYIIICLYFYGSLSIYAVTIPKSLVVVVW